MSATEELVDTTAVAQPSDGGNGNGNDPATDSHGKRRWGRRTTLIVLLIVIGGLLLISGSIFTWYMVTKKPISALPGLPVSHVPHFNYSAIVAQQPLGVAVTSDGGSIYVTQSAGDRTTVMYGRSGQKLAVLTPPKKFGKSHMPLYVAIEPASGDVYVSDRFTGAIYVYTSAGKFRHVFAHKGTVDTWAPLGLAFDSSSHLYVTMASPATKGVYEFTTSGTLIRELKAPDNMSFPNGIAVNANGDIAVADSNNGRAFVWTPAGKLKWTITPGSAPGDLGLPRGVTFDSQGNLIIVDTTDQNVRCYALNADGTVRYVGLFGDQGVGDGLFQYPNGAAADSRAHLYITDRVNNRVQVWSY